MSDSGFDIDRQIKKNRKKEKLFGSAKDKRTGDTVSYPYIDKEGLEEYVKTTEKTEEEVTCEDSETIEPGKKDKQVCIVYSNDYERGINTCEWNIKLACDMNPKVLKNLEQWVNDRIRLRYPASVYLSRENKDKDIPIYNLTVSGSGSDNRCRWCKSFLTSLKTFADRREFDIKKEGKCPFE